MEYVVTLLLGAVLGAVFGAWFSQFIKRPKLKVAGGGGGGGPGPGFHQTHVNIRNEPGLLGIRLHETIVFGRGVHDRIEKGLSVDRNPANECTAAIFDKESGRQVSPLWWRSVDNPSNYQRTVTIQSGQSFHLMIFARLHDENTKYFVYQLDGQSGRPKVPSDEAKFDDTREFVVRVRYSYGRQHLSFPAVVSKGFDGRLSHQSAGSGGSF